MVLKFTNANFPSRQQAAVAGRKNEGKKQNYIYLYLYYISDLQLQSFQKTQSYISDELKLWEASGEPWRLSA